MKRFMCQVMRVVVRTGMSLSAICLVLPAHAIPAFPGAKGYAAEATGGRGGTVCRVTTTADSGPGSLRECVASVCEESTEEGVPPNCQHKDNVIVVFGTSGTIMTNSELLIGGSNITIAGQTAPGQGITIRTDGTHTRNTLSLKAYNVILRGLTLRHAPSSSPNGADALSIGANTDTEGDKKLIIVDHVSSSWHVDEQIIYRTNTITLQNTIVSEGLSNSSHKEGEHSKGTLVRYSDMVTLFGNLWAHNKERAPRIQGGLADVVNNVTYNTRSVAWFDNSAKPNDGNGNEVQVNYTGNVIKDGQLGTRNCKYQGADVPCGPLKMEIQESNMYEADNVWMDIKGTPHTAPIFKANEDESLGSIRDVFAPAATAPLGTHVTPMPAAEAFEYVLTRAGASWGVDCKGQVFYRRDAHDVRIVDDVRNGTGNLIDDPEQACVASGECGWLNIPEEQGCPDGDNDGMPDEWEGMHGLNPAADDSAGDADGDGYTNIEEYINATNPAAGSDADPLDTLFNTTTPPGNGTTPPPGGEAPPPPAPILPPPDAGNCASPAPAGGSMAQVTGSSVSDSGSLPEHTLDGCLDPESRWSSSVPSEWAWIAYDLGQAQGMDGMSIAWHEGDTRRTVFLVYASHDGQTWQQVTEPAESGGTTTALETVTFPHPVIARHIILFAYHAEGSHITEVQFPAAMCTAR